MSAVCRLCAGSLVWAVVWAAALPHTTRAQSSPVRGLYHWIHSTGDAERSFAFYRDLFGVELARSPFAGPAPASAPPERIRPAAEAGSDPLVWDLTNTHGSRFRTVFMHAPNTPFGLELSEFFDVPRGERPPNPWDPGAATLVFTVRDLGVMVSKLKARGAPVVTLGGGAIDSPRGRAILVRVPEPGQREQEAGDEEEEVHAEEAVVDHDVGGLEALHPGDPRIGGERRFAQHHVVEGHHPQHGDPAQALDWCDEADLVADAVAHQNGTRSP